MIHDQMESNADIVSPVGKSFDLDMGLSDSEYVMGRSTTDVSPKSLSYKRALPELATTKARDAVPLF